MLVRHRPPEARWTSPHRHAGTHARQFPRTAAAGSSERNEPSLALKHKKLDSACLSRVLGTQPEQNPDKLDKNRRLASHWRHRILHGPCHESAENRIRLPGSSLLA